METRPAPNLVPLLDVMFILLLFFMLGADFGPRELELIELPRARCYSDCMKGWWRPLQINAHHRDDRACAGLCRVDEHWQLTVNGLDCTDPALLRSTIVFQAAKQCREPIRDRRIIIRADAGAPFWVSQRAMNACAELGFKRVYAAARYGG